MMSSKKSVRLIKDSFCKHGYKMPSVQGAHQHCSWQPIVKTLITITRVKSIRQTVQKVHTYSKSQFINSHNNGPVSKLLVGVLAIIRKEPKPKLHLKSVSQVHVKTICRYIPYAVQQLLQFHMQTKTLFQHVRLASNANMQHTAAEPI